MNILDEINQAGLSLTLEGNLIKVSNPDCLTDDLRNLIRNNKPEIVSQLSKSKSAQSNELVKDIQEQIEERAAIMEYDGGLSRHDAEQAAAAAIKVYCYRVTDKPNTELTVIMPNTSLLDAHESLTLRFGDKLLSVYESTHCLGLRHA